MAVISASGHELSDSYELILSLSAAVFLHTWWDLQKKHRLVSAPSDQMSEVSF